MSVSFEDAKSTLHSMFPAMDEETIGDILREHNGHMERAVEVLLTFCGEASPESQIGGAPAPVAAPPQNRPAPSAQRGGFDPTLPPDTGGFGQEGEGDTFPAPSDDFLTLGRYMGGGPGPMWEDEYLARQLQDALFLQELKENPEAMRRVQAVLAQRRGAGGQEAHAEGGTFDSLFSLSAEDMKKKLGSMSEAAKHKTMALVNQIRGTPAGPAAAPSSQYRSLAVDNDDEESATGLTADSLTRRAHHEEDDEYSSLHDKRGAVRMQPMGG
eukprot:CAMPEP_0181298614 /NCGR_PEP_ID=MMETSP1101-20121128/5880_1 /TAXON_ID=46948 /ORGANISM="Rhodomonas abbreviata, Strain Caron Lab Isolate" /LENGTH=269 /DNA_ID=CAMNT_0023403655 /DNA_START=69 /DNA_END=875 /DNA_ORIENTATION=+